MYCFIEYLYNICLCYLLINVRKHFYQLYLVRCKDTNYYYYKKTVNVI
ncbi:hypothetical protein HMPREF0673_01329 [Leyella stercorea DSM 18206]|uniref:Uncharacterized protein n=1 Tax=Leyella stercorea DSM 18206 TaxID=1002367 RepID=G6AXG9_9BACT|nr:hypothetical protein HMPREF0673_01329 [Leyella stercorea DSM 18206]